MLASGFSLPGMASRTAYSTWTTQKPTLFDGHYLRKRSTLDVGVLGYIGIVQHKEHSPEILFIPSGTPCILPSVCTAGAWRDRQLFIMLCFISWIECFLMMMMMAFTEICCSVVWLYMSFFLNHYVVCILGTVFHFITSNLHNLFHILFPCDK